MIENSRIISLKDASRFVIDAISDGDWRERIDNLPTLKDVELISEEEIEKFLLRIEDEPEAKATTEFVLNPNIEAIVIIAKKYTTTLTTGFRNDNTVGSTRPDFSSNLIRI